MSAANSLSKHGMPSATEARKSKGAKVLTLAPPGSFPEGAGVPPRSACAAFWVPACSHR